MNGIEQYNLEHGNLSLADTEWLLDIQSLLEDKTLDRALAWASLNDFIANRGYNENPSYIDARGRIVEGLQPVKENN